MAGLCYDIEGNTVDCTSTDATGFSSGVSATDVGAGLNLTSSNNPVAAQAASTMSPSWLTSLLNIAPSAISAAVGPAPTSGLRLQVNPATGQTQYFNPATGQYLAGNVNTSGSLLGGGSGFFFIIIALVIGFFAFYGNKRAESAA